MFEGFANVWTPILPARALQKGIARVRLAGESIALARDDRGETMALVAQSGASNEPHLPTREALGFVWVFTGLDARGTEPAVPVIEQKRAVAHHVETWPAPFDRVMEALLDPANLPFSFGMGPPGARRFELERGTSSARLSLVTEGGALAPVFVLGLPGMLELFLPPSSTKRRSIVYCAPETATTTHVLFFAARPPHEGAVPAWVTDWFVATDLAREQAVAGTIREPSTSDTSLAAVAFFRRQRERARRAGSARRSPSPTLRLPFDSRESRVASRVPGTPSMHS